jgi:WD40 repeat protein
MSPDGRIIAAGVDRGIICVWEAGTGQLMERLQGCTGWSNYIAFTPDGKGLVSGSKGDSTLKYWDISNVLRGGKAMPKEMKDARRNGEKSKERVSSIAVSQDGEWIVSGHRNGEVQFWDARTRELQLMLRGHKDTGSCYVLCTRLIVNDSCAFLVYSIAISSQCGMIASCDTGGQVRICKYTNLRVCTGDDIRSIDRELQIDPSLTVICGEFSQSLICLCIARMIPDFCAIVLGLYVTCIRCAN